MISFFVEANMNDNIENLKEKFLCIKNKGWIESISNSCGSVGITFERLLGNKENCSSLPDYNNIELKCTTVSSTCPITLFSMSFDGPSLYETLRIINRYGYPDKIFKSKKIIYANLGIKSNYLVSNLYYFSLKMEKEKIYLVIKDLNDNLIEKKSYITFQSIQNHLYKKLKYLAIINAYKKNKNGKKYFKYINLSMYKIKDFDTFLELIEKGIIKISLISRINKSKKHYGKISYKNIIFNISKYNINYLFDKIN